ncbi:S8 family serine peptidase [Teredinibacter haidensis]|uniref:S8 family serine peptidase n=1 Tax=Teredinibacter haidensis TaxID=2731755 RepID=UPI00094912D6|nr:S8 family serine peptidase [Teredinibacter haidensis]
MNFMGSCHPFRAIVIAAVTTLSFSFGAYANENFRESLVQAPSLETRYIVKFKNSAGLSSLQSSSRERSAQESILTSSGAKIRTRMQHLNAISVTGDRQKIAELRARSSVEYVELDPPRRLLSQTQPWGIAAVGASLIDDSNTAGKTVCIIDSGYDIANPDLSTNNHAGTNVSGTGSWYVPGGSHGTHVAGTIAAANNSEGVLGVMPNGLVNIHIVKVFDDGGWGYASDLIDAIGVCADAGADVVNMSLGGDTSSTSERNALQSYTDQGLLLIAAAGNDGNTAHSYPASYASVVSVGAVDENLDHADFSQATSQVEVAAPGEAILSTVGVGDGVQSSIAIGGTHYGDNQVVPHNRYILSGSSYINQAVSGVASGELAICGRSGGNFNCANMSGKICLAERFGNQGGGVYPEIDPVLACANAGAVGAIVYSNSNLPGLQNPFLIDDNSDIAFPSVSVNRDLGTTLASSVGSSVTLQTTSGTDYAYYNGTSMATPHVSGVAALVWSYHPECSAGEIRSVLSLTSMDIGSGGRDNQTGYGLIKADAALAYLDESGCAGAGQPNASELENGTAQTGLSVVQGGELLYTISVPENASNLTISISGGSGDADLYVRYGSEPTTDSYDCRPYLSGNTESCDFGSPSAGTYYVQIIGYSSASDVSLIASYDADSGGGQTIFENNSNYSIPDNNKTGVYSPITVNNSGTANNVTVEVDITHTYISDLIVDVIAPDGSVKNIHDRSGGSANDISQTYVIDFGSTQASGEWSLHVRDRASRDTGYIDRWEISFQ